MPLPIVPGSESISTPSGGAPLDVRPLREAALAPGRLAAAIGQDVGGTFQDISQQIQDTRNAKKVFDADLQLRNTKDQFLADIQKDPNLAKDPGTWVPAYQDRVKQATDSILNQPNLAPVVKRHLDQMTAVWAASTTADVRTQALHREVADTKASGLAVATKAIQDGQPDVAIAAYKALNEKGVIGPKYSKALIDQVPERVADAQAATILATAGDQAERVMKDQMQSKMAPKRFGVALRAAQEVTKKAQAENAEDISGQMDDDPEHALPKQAKFWRDSGKITQTQYERLQNRVKGYAQAETEASRRQQTDDYNVAMMRADTPPTDPTKLQSWAADVKLDGLSWTNPALRRRLSDYVDRKVENVQKTGQSEENPIKRDIFDEAKKNWDLGLFRPATTDIIPAKPAVTHWFKQNEEAQPEQQVVKSPEPQTSWITDADEKTRTGAALNYARWQDKMRDFFQANPKATQEQAELYGQKLMQPHVEAQAKAALGGDGSVRVRTKDGRIGTIPAANLQKALDAGYTQIK